VDAKQSIGIRPQCTGLTTQIAGISELNGASLGIKMEKEFH